MVAYAIFSGVGILCSVYDFIVARRIVSSDDVSNSFIEPVAYRIHCVFWYSHYCFIKAVETNKGIKDTLTIFVYQVIWNGKYLLSSVPQFIFALIYSFIIGELNTNDITSRSTATVILKIILILIRVGCLFGCLLVYPFLRFYFIKGHLHTYTRYRFEKIIELTLWRQTHKFSENQENQTQQSPNPLLSSSSSSSTIPLNSEPQQDTYEPPPTQINYAPYSMDPEGISPSYPIPEGNYPPYAVPEVNYPPYAVPEVNYPTYAVPEVNYPPYAVPAVNYPSYV
jgi:hypothetical protein